MSRCQNVFMKRRQPEPHSFEPSKPVRTIMTLSSELHTALRMLAAAQQRSMNDLVVEALMGYVEPGMRDLNQFVDGWLASKRGEGLFDFKVKQQQEELMQSKKE
jgi:HicB family